MSRLLFLSLLLGIVGAQLTRLPTLGWACLGLGVLLLFLKGKRQGALILLFFAAGVLLTGFRLARLYAPEYGLSSTFVVESTKLLQAGEGYCAWQGKVLEPLSQFGATVLVYAGDYRPGVYALRGKLFPPVEYRNPGQGWHYIRKLYANEIGVLNRPEVLSFRGQPLSLLAKARNRYRNNLKANITNPEAAALALALTTGDRSLMPGELKEAVNLTGVGHLLAMSGLHVGVFLGLALAVFRRLGLSFMAANAAGFACVLAFVVFVGPSPSLVRAVLMSAQGIAALLWGREKQGLQALEWTGLGMLLYNPLWLFDYAFVFSFLATFVCLAGVGRIEPLLTFLPKFLCRTASLTFLIQLAALPLVLYLYGGTSLWAPLANLALVPLAPALAGFSVLAALLPGGAGMILAWPGALLLRGVAAFLSLLNKFPLPLSFGGIQLALTAVCSCGLILYLLGLRFRQTLYCIVSGMLVVVLLFSFFQYGVTTVWFLDVGQGDAALIRSKGQWVLVDCGDAWAGQKALLPTLRFLGVKGLTAVVLSHSHEDHRGGFQPLIENIPTGQVYCSFPLDYAGAQIVLGEVAIGPEIMVLSHNQPVANPNDASLLVTLGGNQVLFCGDIEEEGERLYRYYLRPFRVLKTPHHGSDSSSSPEFLASVSAQAAIISCGLGNRYGLPGNETLNNLARAQAAVFRTDLQGFVRVDFWPWGTMRITTFGGW